MLQLCAATDIVPMRVDCNMCRNWPHSYFFSLLTNDKTIIDIKPAAIEVANAFGFSTELTGNYDAVIEACGSKVRLLMIILVIYR